MDKRNITEKDGTMPVGLKLRHVHDSGGDVGVMLNPIKKSAKIRTRGKMIEIILIQMTARKIAPMSDGGSRTDENTESDKISNCE